VTMLYTAQLKIFKLIKNFQANRSSELYYVLYCDWPIRLLLTSYGSCGLAR